MEKQNQGVAMAPVVEEGMSREGEDLTYKDVPSKLHCSTATKQGTLSYDYEMSVV